MILGSWTFKPGLWPTIGLFILLPILIRLGFWQLDRGQQKIELHETFMQRQAYAPVNFSEAKDKPLEDLYWSSFYLQGQFVEGPQFYLDNQVENTVVGYHVFTLFKADNLDKLLLVNRGWINLGTDRQTLLEADYPREPVKLLVEAKPLPYTGVEFIELLPEKVADNYRIQRIKVEQLTEIVNQKVLPLSFRLQPESQHGLVRNWKKPGSDHAKHYGYSFQWFAMAFALSIIYLILNIKRSKND